MTTDRQDEEAHALVKVAQQSLEAGIAVCAAGVPYEEIGQAIESDLSHCASGRVG